MKIIDLINDYSNGKELPEKIKVHGTEFIHDCYLCYKSQAFDREQYLFTEDYNWSDWLNEEVEIIEDKPFNKKVEEIYKRHIDYICGEEDKKIEKLTTSLIDIKVLTDEIDTKLDYSGDYDRLVNKINEIIDYINKEK